LWCKEKVNDIIEGVCELSDVFPGGKTPVRGRGGRQRRRESIRDLGALGQNGEEEFINEAEKELSGGKGMVLYSEEKVEKTLEQVGGGQHPRGRES